MKENTCCFTGHRPQKLPWGFDESDARCTYLKKYMYAVLSRAIRAGYTHFISGMALGGDIYFAEAVLSLKEKYPHIQLECAIPYQKQPAAWGIQDRMRYRDILEQCDTRTLLAKAYFRGCLLARNRYMVDQSDLLLAAYMESSGGGTKSTVAYAEKKGLKIVYLPLTMGKTEE